MGSNKDDKPVSGELMRAENKLVRAENNDRMPVIKTLIARVSRRFAFRNFWERKKVASVRGVITEETELFREVTEHQQSYNRLKNIGTILRDDNAVLEANALAAESRLAAEQRKEAAREKEDIIFASDKDIEVAKALKKKEFELYKQDLEYKASIAELEKNVASFEPKKPLRGSAASREKAEINKEIRRFEEEKEKIEKSGDTAAIIKRRLKAATTAYEKTIAAIEAKYKKEA